jgi:hypothetical protein
VIQKYLPYPRHCEVHRIFVEAIPEVAWNVARHFDGAQIPWVRFFFDLRGIGDLISGHKSDSTDRRLGVDQVAESSTGFHVLHETPGKEVVVGAIGQFWHLDIPFGEIQPDEYASFHEHGWGKVAWAIRVEPYHNGSTISFELRTTATDERSWNTFSRYYKLISIGSIPIRNAVMSHLEAELGKMRFPHDHEIVYPGDELIPEARYSITFHKLIEAPVSLVWRYLMQLGCDRAGWYSIDALDHGGLPSIDLLIDGWETRKPGDRLAATLALDSFYEVYAVEPEKHFVIGGETGRLGGPFKMTWAFVTEAVGDDATHLVSNARMVASPKWAEWFMGNLLYPPIHGLMSGVQLKNLKRICERLAHERSFGLQATM